MDTATRTDERQDLVAARQHATRQLPEDEVVAFRVTAFEGSDESRLGATEVVDPDGRVDEHQRGRL